MPSRLFPSGLYRTLRYCSHLRSKPTASAPCRCLVLRRKPLALTSSCYAFFKGWLLLSQPPGCFGISTSFPTLATNWGLSCWSRLFSPTTDVTPAAVSPPCSTRRYSRLSSLVGCPGPPSPSSALPLRYSHECHLNRFRGEPAISAFWLAFHPHPQVIRVFSNRHRFGPPAVLPCLQPALP